jgi:hypothetical protein
VTQAAATAADGDVAANRTGRLSPAQAAVVVSMEYGTMMASVGVPMGALSALGIVTMAAYTVSPVVGVVAFAVAAGPVAAGAWWAVKRVRAGAKDRAQATGVRAVDGFVAWAGAAWTAFAGAVGHASAPSLGPLVLPPGPFRFYLHGARIVGAESPLGPGAWSIAQILEPPSLATSMTMSGTTRMTALPLGDRGMLAAAIAHACPFTPEDGAFTREGPVQVRWRMRDKMTVLQFLVLGDEEIPVTPALAGAVVPGLAYRVHRSARDRRVLGVEPL